MRRRTLLGLGALASALVAGGGLAWLRFARPAAPPPPATPGDPRELCARLREHFPYLELPEATLSRFADEYERLFGPWPKGRRPTSRLFTTFLLSTDFFQHGMDEARPLTFVTFYLPYKSPCYNPLRRA